MSKHRFPDTTTIDGDTHPLESERGQSSSYLRCQPMRQV